MPPGRSICGAASAVRSNRPPRPPSGQGAERSALLSSLAELARDYIQLRGMQAELRSPATTFAPLGRA